MSFTGYWKLTGDAAPNPCSRLSALSTFFLPPRQKWEQGRWVVRLPHHQALRGRARAVLLPAKVSRTKKSRQMILHNVYQVLTSLCVSMTFALRQKVCGPRQGHKRRVSKSSASKFRQFVHTSCAVLTILHWKNQKSHLLVFAASLVL